MTTSNANLSGDRPKRVKTAGRMNVICRKRIGLNRTRTPHSSSQKNGHDGEPSLRKNSPPAKEAWPDQWREYHRAFFEAGKLVIQERAGDWRKAALLPQAREQATDLPSATLEALTEFSESSIVGLRRAALA